MSSRSALALVALLCGCGPQLGSESSAIVGGQTTSDFPAVILTLAHQAGSMEATICTGIVISPHVVLTAAHCVSPDNVGANAIYNLYEGADLNFASSQSLLPVASIDFDPDYDVKAFTKGFDLGVVVTTDPLVPAPMPINRKSLTKDLVGRAATLVGYEIQGLARQAVALTRARGKAALAEAGDLVHRALVLFEQQRHLEGSEEDVYVNCLEVLKLAGANDRGAKVRARGKAEVQRKLAALTDPRWRTSYASRVECQLLLGA